MLWFRFHSPSSPLMLAVTNKAGCFGDLRVTTENQDTARIRSVRLFMETAKKVFTSSRVNVVGHCSRLPHLTLELLLAHSTIYGSTAKWGNRIGYCRFSEVEDNQGAVQERFKTQTNWPSVCCECSAMAYRFLYQTANMR